MFRAVLLAASLLLGSNAAVTTQGRPPATEVDLQLVLAVDISYSMDPEEQRLQREGYLQAIVSPEVIAVIGRGLVGKVAMTYVEWAGAHDQQVVVGWRVIDSLASAQAFANEIAARPIRRGFRTSISGALTFSTDLIETSGLRSHRRVIDVSGDGANNHGQIIEPVRDAVLAKGITINGLPIMLNRPTRRNVDIDNLDAYYQDCVVGGRGSFVIPIKEESQFVPATRRKLILEVAGILPAFDTAGEAVFTPAQSEKVDCLIGERMWRERWERN